MTTPASTTFRRLATTAFCASLALGSSAAFAAGGAVKGTVTLKGKAPENAAINMKADPYCAKQPGGGKDEEVVVGKGGELKNVVVRIAKGVAAPSAAPTTPAVVDQQG